MLNPQLYASCEHLQQLHWLEVGVLSEGLGIWAIAEAAVPL